MTKVIPSVILAIFILFMNSGTFFKKYGLTEPVPFYFQRIEQMITRGEWQEAAANLNRLESAWRRAVRLLQFSEERDEINNFQHSLARLKGYVAAEETGGALAALYELEETWADLGK
ncbi:MAG TPA: DUF4363 family protein [Firmicutes bacterium]|uniref:DUF4363 family protein n=1 Tax=Capillibacterium thermochitinicola TaxID=2699427 RepID=A0A8J6I0D0_9FIRM|nr:DUF4363 family protein [Capillibacterium thermochitinicola]MBA2133405.1 DUF4363 family protein [Capillibacterium thermochitinicola]HHW13056.1 DUF4363 family protein [Bacillota bacterium]